MRQRIEKVTQGHQQNPDTGRLNIHYVAHLECGHTKSLGNHKRRPGSYTACEDCKRVKEATK